MTEISLNNSAAVPEATMDSSAGQVEQIKRQALATETTARIESAKADEASRAAAGSDAFSVIASTAAEALLPGAKTVITSGEFVAARVEDRNGVSEASPVAPVHIDASIEESTQRSPGLYRAPVAESVYGGDPKTAKDLSANIVEKVETTSMSLKQPKDFADLFRPEKEKPFDGMKCETDKNTLQTAQLAKQLVIGNQLASEQALVSTKVWEQKHGAAMGMAMGGGVAPSVAMKLAPRDIQGLVNEVRDDQGAMA